MSPSPANKAAPAEGTGAGLMLGSRLRQQVVGTTAAITLIAMAALTLLVHEVLASTVEGDVSGLLRSRADAVAATLTLSNGEVIAQETPTEALDRTNWIHAVNGSLVEGPASQGARNASAWSASGRTSSRDGDHAGKASVVDLTRPPSMPSALVPSISQVAPFS